MNIEKLKYEAQSNALHIADVSGSALINADCMYILPLISDKSVQLILADLPYGNGKTSCKWDSVLDLNKLWIEYERIISDNGAIILTSAQPFTTQLIASNYRLFKYELIWDKVNRYTGFAQANIMPLKRHENILVFAKNKTTYNKQYRKGKPYKASRTNGYGEQYTNGKNYKRTDTINNGNHNPCSIIEIKSDNKKEMGLHPTQKPLELMKYLISTYSNENDLVLDNTMGVGTCPLAAKELNRRFIGIEKEPKYYEIACQRCGF